ncbi:uncharacterized protein [Pyrus communis]|uniref:uncharacterized protein n=1 Tax=Pyrus communis TaxID=23211 RepID=UPI0035BEE5AE
MSEDALLKIYVPHALHLLLELEGLSDPMRKDVSQVRKKINAINKELKSLGHTCQKKVTQLGFLPHSDVNVYCYAYAIMDQFVSGRDEFRLVSESEKTKMKKLEELSNNIESLK